MPSADITEGDSDTQANETTALLASSAEQPAARETDNESDTPDCDSSKDEDVPLPRDQILYLCFARFVEPVAFFCIFPFINQMIWETGEVAETDVGFYSGMIVRSSLLAFLHVASLTEAQGIIVLINPDGAHDSMGQSSRPNWQKASTRWLTGRRCRCNRDLRSQQNFMADDRVSMLCRPFRRNHCVGRASRRQFEQRVQYLTIQKVPSEP